MSGAVLLDTSSVPSWDSVRSRLAASLAFELQQLTELLSQSVAVEESKAVTRNLAAPEYPMLARALRNRIDNLQKTISTLEVAAGQALERPPRS